MNEPLSREERINLPNTLLFDPHTGRAAAYNGIHRLITGAATPALVAYARAKGYREEMWNEVLYTPGTDWYAMPPWATNAARSQCTLYWLRSGEETDEELRAIPPR